jgi:peptide/nickel transport system substrate-binding protein
MKNVVFSFAAVLLISMGLVTACTQRESAGETASAGGTVNEKTIVLTGGPWETFNVLDGQGNDGDLVHEQIWDKLVYNKADGNYEPRLAKSWENSSDGTYMIFTIDERAKWHDGNPVTADDVVFTAQALSNPKIQARRRGQLRWVAGVDNSGAELSAGSVKVTALDKYQVKIEFKAPTDPDVILQSFNRYFYVIPRHIYGVLTPEQINAAESWDHPIGSGPFKYVSSTEGEQIEFVVNKDYHLGRSGVDRLVIRLIDNSTRMAGLISGDIDILRDGIDPVDWENANAQANLVCKAVPTYKYTVLALNTQAPYLTQKVRQAISYAIDRNTLIDVILKGQGQALAGPFTSVHPYYNQDLPTKIYDPDLAKRLLQEAGWKGSQELVFLVTVGNTVRLRTAELVQQNLEAVGMKIRIQQVDFPTLMKTQREGGSDIALLSSAGSLDPNDAAGFVTPSSSANFSRIQDPLLENLTLEGSKRLVRAERKPFYDQFQAVLRDQVPIVYLYSEHLLSVHNTRLTNVPVDDFINVNWGTWKWQVR